MKPIDQIKGHNLWVCKYLKIKDIYDWATHHSCGHPRSQHEFDGKQLCDQPCTLQDWEHCPRNQ